MALGEYNCSRGAFAQGTYGRVSAGWAKSGRGVAIKRFTYPKASELKTQEDVMNILGQHDNIVGLLKVITDFQSEYPSAYCVYGLLAIGGVTDIIETHVPDLDAKLTLLADHSRGLAFMHGKGFMHRDINPNNLAIVSFDPPRGIILDLDSAMKSETCYEHNIGTKPYVALRSLH
ncbi:MAG: hypothetical protein M1816_000901 [Peltula sp. TS41687]|nr:MAG: hypothetical protein M1816_000901 [Peltula sp. TS41687]